MNKNNNNFFHYTMTTFRSGGGGETHEDVIPTEKNVLVDDDQLSQPLTLPPLISSYNDSMMRPLLDAIHTLRCMNVIEEGLTLPTIVVIGDQSSGKSSVIESLTGISLPRGQGICTRVPLIMKLQHHSEVSEINLEYQGKSIPVNETPISEAINLAMDGIAGNGKGISDVPLTVVVKKNSVPDLTIIDLPGIPDHDQSGNIYKKISNIIVKYIKPEESLILNVMSATADFLTCESMRMSKKFDKSGQRTLHVFTKADKSLEDMVAIVTTNMGPDYMCVRNQLGDETFEEARTKEANLFRTHSLLSQIDKSIVGIHVLAQKLVLLQLASISKCLGEIVRKINEDLNMSVLEQNRSRQHFVTISEAMPTFMEILKLSEKSLSKIAITFEFDEFPDETQMHCYPRLVEMLNEFSQQLKKNQEDENENFLTDEILLLQEGKGSEQVFNLLFERKITSISAITDSFVSKVWDYIEVVTVKVLVWHTENYPQLLLSLKKAAKIFIAKTKKSFKSKVLEFLEMKKMEGYTRDPRVISSWNKLKGSRRILNGIGRYALFNDVQVYVAHLRAYPESTLNEAFDIKTRIVACLEMVLKNVIDLVESDLPSMVCRMVENEMETEIVNELKSDDGNRYKPMLKESPLMTTKRWKLKNRIELLGKLKKVVEKTMDEISFHGY